MRSAPALPPCTLAVVAVCVALQVFVFLWEPPLGAFALSARALFYEADVRRVLSSAFFHGGWLHLALNMMSTVAIQTWLERTIGSALTVMVVLWSVVLGGPLACLLDVLAAALTGDASFLRKNAVGYSGVLFTVAVLEAQRSDAASRSVFGVVQVPSQVYPWVLLVLIQVLFPGVYFEGHLAGALVGLLLHYGLARRILPSATCVQGRVDPLCTGRIPNYADCPAEPWPQGSGGSLCDLARTIGSGVATVFVGVYQIAMECCGRGGSGGNAGTPQARAAGNGGEERRSLILRDGVLVRQDQV